MTFEELIASQVQAAVRTAVEPLVRELARVRAALEAEGVSVEEAARRLELSKRVVERKIRSGELPSVKVGGARRVILSAVLPTDVDPAPRNGQERRMRD